MADNPYATEVVKYFRRKSSDGFTEPVTYLGAEQRFVEALKNSNLNNLEEQYILGPDTYTEEYIDLEGHKVIEKSFKKEDTTDNYYKVITIIYEEDEGANKDYFFDNSNICLPDDPATLSIVDNILYFETDQSFSFVDEDDSLRIVPVSFTKVKTDELHYIGDAGSDLLVLSKELGRKILLNGRVITTEIVTNHLES